MTDFFTDNFGEQTKTTETGDAGADFLAQQQDEINGLENQFGISDNAGTNDFFSPSVSDTKLNTNTNMLNLENMDFANTNHINDSDAPITIENEDLILNGLDPIASNTANSPLNMPCCTEQSTPTIISSPYDIKIEAESIAKWRKEFEARIADADSKETKLLSEWEMQAKQDLDDWRRQRQEALEKQRQVNLENEQEFIDERESRSRENGGSGIDWAKVSNLCDFNKTSKKSKDTSRMKSMFLQMKGEAVKETTNKDKLVNGQ